jgi:hypothetical protein
VHLQNKHYNHGRRCNLIHIHHWHKNRRLHLTNVVLNLNIMWIWNWLYVPIYTNKIVLACLGKCIMICKLFNHKINTNKVVECIFLCWSQKFCVLYHCTTIHYKIRDYCFITCICSELRKHPLFHSYSSDTHSTFVFNNICILTCILLKIWKQRWEGRSVPDPFFTPSYHLLFHVPLVLVFLFYFEIGISNYFMCRCSMYYFMCHVIVVPCDV